MLRKFLAFSHSSPLAITKQATLVRQSLTRVAEIVKRRGRDSNPRRCYPQRFSRPPQSTTLPPLLASYELGLMPSPLVCECKVTKSFCYVQIFWRFFEKLILIPTIPAISVIPRNRFRGTDDDLFQVVGITVVPALDSLGSAYNVGRY